MNDYNDDFGPKPRPAPSRTSDILRIGLVVLFLFLALGIVVGLFMYLEAVMTKSLVALAIIRGFSAVAPVFAMVLAVVGLGFGAYWILTR